MIASTNARSVSGAVHDIATAFNDHYKQAKLVCKRNQMEIEIAIKVRVQSVDDASAFLNQIAANDNVATLVGVTATPVGYVTAKKLAEAFKASPREVRRYLRTFPEYQDGKYTHYRWQEGSEELAIIREGFAAFLKTRKGRKA